jgi:hypothetical protein
MKNIKEIYDQIDSWLKNQDSKKIKFLQEQSCYDDKSELLKLQKTLMYHYIINEYKDKKQYIFGEKKITLKEIGQYMLDSMGDYGPEKGESKADFEEDCHHSGYADMRMFKEIKSFWKNLDNDALISVAIGSVSDDYEIDLDGYRCYFLSHSKVYPLIFNYIYYTLKKTSKELDEDLCNDNETMESIENLYPPEELFLPGDDVIDRLYGKKANEKTEKNLNDFKDFIERILTNERFQKEPALKDKMKQLSQIL